MFNLIKFAYKSIQAQVSEVIQTVAAQPCKRCQFHKGSHIKPQIQIETYAYMLPHLGGNLPTYFTQRVVEGPTPIQLTCS